MNVKPPYTDKHTTERPAARINAAHARPGQIDQIGPDQAPNGFSGPEGPLGNRPNISAKTLSKAPIDLFFNKTRPRRTYAHAHEKRAGYYALRAYAQKLLIQANMPGTGKGKRKAEYHRTRSCGAIRHKNALSASIWVSGSNAAPSATMRGIQQCNSVFACPACAPRIASERGTEIKHALDWADANGYEPIMLTFTAAHGLHHRGTVDTTDLASFKAAFDKAYQGTFNSATWRNLADLIGTRIKTDGQHVTASIAVAEVTHGGQHGAHYHKHMLLFVRLHEDIVQGIKAGRKRAKRLRTAYMANTMALIDQVMRPRWLNHLGRNGLTAREDIALHLRAGDKAAARYLSKIASSGGLDGSEQAPIGSDQAVAGHVSAFQTHGQTYSDGQQDQIDQADDTSRARFDYELPGAVNKGFEDQEEGLTVWQVLRAAYDNRGSLDENKWARVYIDHVAALSGSNWITWGHGFKALIGLNDLDDEELADEELADDRMHHLIDLTDQHMQALRATRTSGSFTALINLAAATRDAGRVTQWLTDLTDLIDAWNDARQTAIDRLDDRYWKGLLSSGQVKAYLIAKDRLMRLGILAMDDNPLADDRPPDNRYQARPGPAGHAGRSDRSGYGPDDDTEEFPYTPG